MFPISPLEAALGKNKEKTLNFEVVWFESEMSPQRHTFLMYAPYLKPLF